MSAETLRNIFDGLPWFVSERSHAVEMGCPEHGHVVATEATVPEWTDGKLAAYACDRCARGHVFRWGPPSPVYVRDEHWNE